MVSFFAESLLLTLILGFCCFLPAMVLFLKWRFLLFCFQGPC
jgi:hypothetical protein